MKLEEIRREVLGWIQLAQNMFKWLDFMDTIMNVRIP
jgi:hypothetical protein